MKYQWKRCMTSVLLGALLLSAIGCGGENPTAETQTDGTESAETPYIFVPEEPKEGTMQIIPDITFRTGMQLISQKDHAGGDAITVLGAHDFYGGTAEDPRWDRKSTRLNSSHT